MRLQTEIKKAGQWVSELTVGGSWGKTQPAPVQRNLYWFWFDGLFSSAHDSIYLNFISLYILVLGASQEQIGLMSSLSSLAAAVLLFPGAFLAERYIHRLKEMLVLTGILMRLSLLLLVFVPMFFKGAALVWVAILFSVVRDGIANLGYPGWVGLTHEVVPIDGRGRYFGSRSFIMSVAGIVITLGVGKLITLFTGQLGYQIALGAAFVLGALSVYSFSHITLSPDYTQVERPKMSLRGVLSSLKGQTFFIKLVVTAAIWNFAINISGPFFSVHMLQDLKFSAATIGILAVIQGLSTLLVQNKLGALSDKFGPRQVQLFGMILIPLLPLAWAVATQAWHIALANTFAGVVWAAYNLASFNLLLESVPPNQVPVYTAVYQVVVALSLALGALLGSVVIARWGFVGVMIASAAVRWLATALFGTLIPKPAAPTPPADLT